MYVGGADVGITKSIHVVLARSYVCNIDPAASYHMSPSPGVPGSDVGIVSFPASHAPST